MIQTKIDSLNLSYSIAPDDGVNKWWDAVMTARHGLAVEICEGFGEDLGKNDHQEYVETLYDIEDSVSGIPMTRTKDSLMHGLMVFSKYAGGMASGVSPQRWQQAVIEVADWYVHNVTGYMQNMMTFCPLTGKKTRWDCSGFVTCCLQRYGALMNYDWQPTSSMYTSDSVLAQKLEDAGFHKYSFSWEDVRPFDIMAYAGHVEIYAGQINGKHTSYAWGSYHSSLPCFSAAQRRGYDVIWRCEKSNIFDMFNRMICGNATPGESGLSNFMFTYLYKTESGVEYGKNLPQRLLNGIDFGDAQGHKTFGAGLLFHPNGRYMDSIKSSWTQQELNDLFIQTAKKNVDKVITWASRNRIELNQHQIDSIVSGIYNFGEKFLNKTVCKMIAKNPNDTAIYNVWTHMSDEQGKKYPGLIARRKLEADNYFKKI